MILDCLWRANARQRQQKQLQAVQYYAQAHMVVHASVSHDGRRLRMTSTRVEQIAEDPQEDFNNDVVMADSASTPGIETSEQNVDDLQVKHARNLNSVCRAFIHCGWWLTSSQDYPLATWMKGHREEYLEQLMYLEGRGQSINISHCPDCRGSSAQGPSTSPRFRCVECHGNDVLCGPCMARRHRRQPMHQIEVRTEILLHPNIANIVFIEVEWRVL